MKKEILLGAIGLFVIVFALSLASAATTNITVRTWPESKVSIFVLQPVTPYFTITSKYMQSNIFGLASMVYTGEETELVVKVQIEKNGNLVTLERFDNYEFPTGGTLHLQVIPNNVSKDYTEFETAVPLVVANNTANNTLNNASGNSSANDTNDTNVSAGFFSNITGRISAGAKLVILSKTTYYVAGGAVVLVIVLLAIVYWVRKKRDFTPISGRKIVSHNPDLRSLEKQLAEAQGRIKEQQMEINKMRNKEKIAEAERKLQQDREELEKLRRGL